MTAYSFIQNSFPIIFNSIKSNVGNKIGSGADGECYLFNNDSVIKCSILYDCKDSNSLMADYNNLVEKFNFLINHSPSHIVNLFNYKLVGINFRDTHFGKQEYLLHYYVMEKLIPISNDEEKVFHTIISHNDFNKTKIFSKDKLDEILNNLSLGLDFDKTKVTLFYNQIQESLIEHKDLHERNVMKDINNNFKLIDLDRLSWRKK